MNLRDFLYLDRALVRDFLAQAEGGLVDEATKRQTATGKGGFGGSVGAGPLAVKADKSKEHSVETEAVVRQSAASEFDRLYKYLEEPEDPLVVLDEVADRSVVGQIRRKQFLEVDARVSVSGIQRLMTLFATFGSIAPLMEQFGTDVQVDKEALSGMQALTALGESDQKLPMIATVPGKANLKVGLELNPTGIHTDTWDVDASVLFKVQRIIKGAERYVIGDAFGGLLKLMPEKERRKIMKSLKSPDAAQFDIGDMEIGAPGLIGTPIAIYR